MWFGPYGNTLFQFIVWVSVRQEIPKVLVLQSALGNGLIGPNNRKTKLGLLVSPGTQALRHLPETWPGMLFLGPLLMTT